MPKGTMKVGPPSPKNYTGFVILFEREIYKCIKNEMKEFALRG